MQHLTPAILFASFIQAYARAQLQPVAHSTFGSYENPLTYPSDRTQYEYTPNVYPSSRYEGYKDLPFSLPFNREADKFNADPYEQFLKANNLREPQPPKLPTPETYGFDLDYPTNAQPEDTLPETQDRTRDTKTNEDDSNGTDSTYYQDLKLTENFANYLRRRTRVEPSTTVNDPAHQYNALLGVLMALARAIRNSCSDVNELYDQIYDSTVDSYYKYGLTNAEKVSASMEDYIQRGSLRIAKIRKLREELCENELFCPPAIESRIKDTPLIYVKELETLEAIAHLARSYYIYLKEFNEAAQKGNVLVYLKNNKDRVKDYVMSIVNAVDHLSDRTVQCDKE